MLYSFLFRIWGEGIRVVKCLSGGTSLLRQSQRGVLMVEGSYSDFFFLVATTWLTCSTEISLYLFHPTSGSTFL